MRRNASVLVAAAIGVAWVFSGCATIRPRIVTERFGVADPEGDRKTAEEAMELKEAPKEIQVLKGSLPDGLALSENSKQIIVAPSYEHRYAIMGTVEADYFEPLRGAFTKNYMWTWNYEESWRKAVCWPQVPLKIVTFGLWMIVPVSWPCLAQVPSGESGREEAMISQIKRGAHAMGANVVILTESGSGGVLDRLSLKGFAVKVVEGPDPAAKKESGREDI